MKMLVVVACLFLPGCTWLVGGAMYAAGVDMTKSKTYCHQEGADTVCKTY